MLPQCIAERTLMFKKRCIDQCLGLQLYESRVVLLAYKSCNCLDFAACRKQVYSMITGTGCVNKQIAISSTYDRCWFCVAYRSCTLQRSDVVFRSTRARCINWEPARSSA
eukprot:3794-Heterococcus_DN1.PRE.2